MLHETPIRRWRLATALTALLGIVAPSTVHAQGFIAPSFGYNFSGDAGCRTATDCTNKNWNWGGSIGALGSIVGFEFELTYEGEFTGDRSTEASAVTTLMGNLMLAPRIAIVQPYGIAGIGAIRTKVETGIADSSESENQIGWTIGGGLIIFLQQHVGLKGDLRYYHSFEALDLLGIDLGRNENRIDFGRAGFGVVFKF
jgi:opacity protein-like surface antigen